LALKREKKVRGRLQTLVRNVVIENERVTSDSIASLRPTADFISQEYSEDIRSDDIFEFLYLKISEFIKNTARELKLNENERILISDVLSRDDLEAFENTILEILKSIPCNYTVRVLLEAGTDEPQICVKLSENAHLEVIEELKSSNFLGALGGIVPTQKNIYLVMRIFGFCAISSESSVAIRAVTTLKTFLYLAWNQNLTYNLEFNSIANDLSSYEQHILPKRYIEVLEPKFINYLDILLPLELSAFISKFKLKISLSDFVLENFNEIITDTSMEAERITAAIEWYIDSMITDASTVKFIQTCIGLESLLGDEREDAPLTLTLADRCAYLLAAKMKHRANFRKKFKDMYSIRSKIIHGSSRNLKSEEIEHYVFARSMLIQAIQAELKRL
jgi:hypothetical protein